MADYSLAELVEWMTLESRLSKWGMISCMDRSVLNTLLTQEYIRRFKTTSCLPPVTGSIPNGDRRFALNGFTLNRPQLSFENVALNDSKARLRMNVVGGTQLGLKNVAGDWYTQEIRETSPLQGPELSLNLRLDEVPGTVGERGELRLDLKRSDDFRMTISDDQTDQVLVGAYFQQKFGALPEEQRAFPIGRIERGASEVLRPQSFLMRTQARRRTADDPEGAVLGFIRWEGDTEGEIPRQDSDFRYLIPKDGDHSATVLFEPNRVMTERLVRQVKGMGEDVEFEIRKQSNSLTAVAKRGNIRFPQQDFLSIEFEIPLQYGLYLYPKIDYRVFDAHLDIAAEGLVVTQEDDTFTVGCASRGVITCQILDLDDRDGYLKPLLEQLGFDLTDFKKPVKAGFMAEFSSRYEFEDAEGGRLKQLGFQAVLHQDELQFGEITPPDIPPDNFPEWLIEFMQILMRVTVSGITEAIGSSDSISAFLRGNLQKDFAFAPSIKPFIQDIIKLNFGNTIVGEELHSPRDIAFFGRVNPEPTRFVVNPVEHNLVAGTTQQFAAVPAASNLSWSAEPVLATVLDEQIGTIDPTTGLYTAPAADTFEGPFVRVRVTAVNQDKSFSSSALITVLKRALQVNPLAYVVQAKGKVNLEAGYLGDPGKLRWALKDPAQGGVLAGAGLTAVYTAPEVMPPSDPDDPENSRVAYIVEEVELSETTGGLAQIGVVIAESGTKTPMLITKAVDLAAGTVALQGVINGYPQAQDKTTWAVRCGPGSIDPNTGVYTPGSTGEHAFALLTATFDTGFVGVYEGYVLQPLPLARFEDAVLGTGVYEVQPTDQQDKQ
ncbi:hypothetical protein G7009_27155 [Pseudomonas capeferrum]|uniref:Ig-like domain-containing protein n=1 Tax=Pseudomonas capeferrum TaxID=1495066 RepID=UPI0015E456ED|nr:hypothetical protein [Pseudomonas capeferrum]MBA1205389.1 hypothetical protein [Pseudomonas capeferrum]